MHAFKFLLWQLMIIGGIGNRYSYSNVTSNFYKKSRHTSNYEKLELKVNINGKIDIIDFRRTRQLLANHNLPIWISTNSKDNEYVQMKYIMKFSVGKFRMYHDYRTRSAVIYFHKKQQLFGIVRMKYTIQGIHIRNLDKVHYVSSEGFLHSLNIKKYFRPITPLHDEAKKIVKCELPKLRVYPELLVAISYDMYKAIENVSPETKTVNFPVETIRHVLIVYNIVDLLFRYVKAAAISINIAAIVIEGSKNQWDFESKTSHFRYINGDKITDRVSDHFRQRENYFPRHSYDYIAFNTRRRLLTKKILPILGIAHPTGTSYIFYPHDYKHRSNFAVTDHKSWDHFTTIVHELAHIFTAGHNTLLNWVLTPSCERSIMAAANICSHLCLKWSDETEREFENFFSSQAHCILLNMPRSLFPSYAQKMLTREEQCKCYGYQSSHEINDGSYESGCAFPIICQDENNNLEGNLPYPFDGTPCGHNQEKVCWSEKCVESHRSPEVDEDADYLYYG